VCILYFGFLNLFCDMWVCVLVCLGFVMCGCFDNYVGVLVICVLVFTVFLSFLLYIFILIYCVCTSVRTTAIERKLNCSK
jgi:hypothetical protein